MIFSTMRKEAELFLREVTGLAYRKSRICTHGIDHSRPNIDPVHERASRFSSLLGIHRLRFPMQNFPPSDHVNDYLCIEYPCSIWSSSPIPPGSCFSIICSGRPRSKGVCFARLLRERHCQLYCELRCLQQACMGFGLCEPVLANTPDGPVYYETSEAR